jgi:rhodanese-related sulfurtransferase
MIKSNDTYWISLRTLSRRSHKRSDSSNVMIKGGRILNTFPRPYLEVLIGNSQLVPLSEIEAGEGFAKVQNILQSYEQKHRDKPTVVLYCTSGRL